MPRASSLSRRAPREIELPIIFGGATSFTLTFDANRVTRNWARETDGSDDLFGFYDGVCAIVTSWDLTEDDGSPYELTPENFAKLGLTLEEESEMMTQIVTASVPARAEGNDSSRRRSIPSPVSEAPEPISQNGLETSQLPSDSASPSQT